jgi:L-iditol 2-dehydrogenase
MALIPSTMNAVVYRGRNKLGVEQIEVPQIGAEELLVKVEVCGICPTDIKKIKFGTVPGPRVFGHETSGTIVKRGARVRGFSVGERVALHHHVPCLKCHLCRHRAFAQCEQYKRTGITAGFEPAGGGYAEYVRVMPFVLPGVVKIPKANTFVEGAMLEPVNTVLKGVERLGLIRGDVVLVAGQGPIGLMFTRLLRLRGMRVLATDLMESRLEIARTFGAEESWRPQHGRAKAESLEEVVMRMTAGRGLDGAVIAVPSDTVMREAQALLRGAGRVLLFSHTKRGARTTIDLATVCVDEKDILGSYSADFLLQGEVARIVFSRKLDVRSLISHRFGLAETARAIDLAAEPTPESLKIVIEQGVQAD